MSNRHRAAGREQEETRFVVRFSPRQRAEHLLIMVLFTVLAVTGLPQEFFEARWAQWLIPYLGGIDRVRWLHRVCGILFTLGAVEHIAVLVFLVATKRIQLTMVPAKKDFRDAIMTLRYYFGVSEEEAQFDRYDYRQKFEYWGLIFGSMIMVVTGFVLYLPSVFARFLPGELIPAAKVAHASEGLLAFLIVIIWHIYNAHLNPDVFPFDTGIFTGKVSEERMLKEHPLELARLKGRSFAADERTSEGTRKPETGSDPP